MYSLLLYGKGSSSNSSNIIIHTIVHRYKPRLSVLRQKVAAGTGRVVECIEEGRGDVANIKPNQRHNVQVE